MVALQTLSITPTNSGVHLIFSVYSHLQLFKNLKNWLIIFISLIFDFFIKSFYFLIAVSMNFFHKKLVIKPLIPSNQVHKMMKYL